MGSLKFRILPAPATLQDDVACFHIAEYSGKEAVAINVLPNAVPGLLFQHSNGWPALDNITTHTGCKRSTPTLFVYGAGTEPSVMHYKASAYVMINVVFKPHALNSLLGINAATLTDCAVELNEFSREKLNDQLLDARDEQEQIALLTAFLLAQRSQVQARDPVIEAGLALIHQNIPSITVNSLLHSLNLSERQFERRFRQAVGISAQSYIRVKRFNAALQLMKTGQYARLTDIAHALHFSDQSHFIREVKAFSGITPKHLAQKIDDFHHEQIGYSYR